VCCCGKSITENSLSVCGYKNFVFPEDVKDITRTLQQGCVITQILYLPEEVTTSAVLQTCSLHSCLKNTTNSGTAEAKTISSPTLIMKDL
jgi:hypothetical protein